MSHKFEAQEQAYLPLCEPPFFVHLQNLWNRDDQSRTACGLMVSSRNAQAAEAGVPAALAQPGSFRYGSSHKIMD